MVTFNQIKRALINKGLWLENPFEGYSLGVHEVQISPEALDRFHQYQSRFATYDNNAKIQELVDIINNGQWDKNASPLVMDVSGRVLDGMYRLMAMQKSGKAVPVRIKIVPMGLTKEDVTSVFLGDRVKQDLLDYLGESEKQFFLDMFQEYDWEDRIFQIMRNNGFTQTWQTSPASQQAMLEKFLAQEIFIICVRNPKDYLTDYGDTLYVLSQDGSLFLGFPVNSTPCYKIQMPDMEQDGNPGWGYPDHITAFFLVNNIKPEGDFIWPCGIYRDISGNGEGDKLFPMHPNIAIERGLVIRAADSENEMPEVAGIIFENSEDFDKFKEILKHYRKASFDLVLIDAEELPQD